MTYDRVEELLVLFRDPFRIAHWIKTIRDNQKAINSKMAGPEFFVFLILSALSILVAYLIQRLIRFLGEYQSLKEGKLAELELKEKELEYQHRQEMEKLKVAEESNVRKDNMEDSKSQREQERLLKGQTEVFEIMKDTFGKVQDVDMNQAVFSGYILQSIHTGKELNENVMKTLAEKVPAPLPSSAELDQIVASVMQNCDQKGDGEEDSFDDDQNQKQKRLLPVCEVE